MIQGIYLGVPDRMPIATITLEWTTPQGRAMTRTCTAVVDTGAERTVIYRRVFAGKAPVADADLPGGSCHLSIEQTPHAKPVAILLMNHAHAGSEDGLLGQDVLAEYVATFDGPAGTWTLTP